MRCAGRFVICRLLRFRFSRIFCSVEWGRCARGVREVGPVHEVWAGPGVIAAGSVVRVASLMCWGLLCVWGVRGVGLFCEVWAGLWGVGRAVGCGPGCGVRRWRLCCRTFFGRIAARRWSCWVEKPGNPPFVGSVRGFVRIGALI